MKTHGLRLFSKTSWNRVMGDHKLCEGHANTEAGVSLRYNDSAICAGPKPVAAKYEFII